MQKNGLILKYIPLTPTYLHNYMKIVTIVTNRMSSRTLHNLNNSIHTKIKEYKPLIPTH